MLSQDRTNGPRAIRRSQRRLEIAQAKMKREKEEVTEKQTSYIKNFEYESTAKSAQTQSANRLVRQSALDVSSEEELKKLTKGSTQNEGAVTYWSHEVTSGNNAHFPATPLQKGAKLFSKCTHFSNEIEDSRVEHRE